MTANPSELSLHVSVHWEQQLILYKCFLYIPGKLILKPPCAIDQWGYDFALSNFLQLQTGLVTANVGLDPLCWIALALYMRSERGEGMLACIDAGQWTYSFNLLKDLNEASFYCWSHLSGSTVRYTSDQREINSTRKPFCWKYENRSHKFRE